MTDNKIIFTHKMLESACLGLGGTLSRHRFLDPSNPAKVFPIPRGGVPATYALASHFNLDIVDTPEEADFFFDDIIDSGATMKKWSSNYPGIPFFALIDKTDEDCKYLENWLIFPWEGSAEASVEDSIIRLLQFIGEKPNRGGLVETPARVARAWSSWCAGYSQSPRKILKVFEDGSEKCDEIVIVRNIPFYSHCEHHMAPFFGTASIGYIPNGSIVGLSKLSRLLDIYAKRLQVQERLTNQIADAIMEHLGALGCGVTIEARHLCMESRGICKQGHSTVTNALRGVILDKPETRAEYMGLVAR